jgi:hypothetical protein
MSWHCVTFTTADIVGKKHMDLQDDFDRRWLAAGLPRDAALFASDLDREGRSVYYFSPGAMLFSNSILSAYGGTPCSPPPPGAALLVGHDDVREELVGPWKRRSRSRSFT